MSRTIKPDVTGETELARLMFQAARNAIGEEWGNAHVTVENILPLANALIIARAIRIYANTRR